MSSPYDAPLAEVVENSPLGDANAPTVQTLAASAGAEWVTLGFRLAFSRPGLYLGITVIIFIIGMLTGGLAAFVPIIGDFASYAIGFMLSAGCVHIGQHLLRGEDCNSSELFTPMSDAFGPMLLTSLLATLAAIAGFFMCLIPMFIVVAVGADYTGILEAYNTGSYEMIFDHMNPVVIGIALLILTPVMLVMFQVLHVAGIHGCVLTSKYQFKSAESYSFAFKAALANLKPLFVSMMLDFLILIVAVVVIGLTTLIHWGLTALLGFAAMFVFWMYMNAKQAVLFEAFYFNDEPIWGH